MFRIAGIVIFTLFLATGCSSNNNSAPSQANEVTIDESVLNTNSPMIEETVVDEDSLLLDGDSKYFDPKTGLLRPDMGEAELEGFVKDMSMQPVVEPAHPDE